MDACPALSVGSRINSTSFYTHSHVAFGARSAFQKSMIFSEKEKLVDIKCQPVFLQFFSQLGVLPPGLLVPTKALPTVHSQCY